MFFIITSELHIRSSSHQNFITSDHHIRTSSSLQLHQFFPQPDRRLPARTNRALNNRQYVNRAEQIARDQLSNRYWRVHYEDNTFDALWSRHNSICLDMVARTKIKKHDTVEVRFNCKNPRTDTYNWQANVLLVGKKEYIEEWNKDAWVQITNAQSARKKLIMNENVETRFQETRAKTHSQDENDNALLHDENQYPELDPNDVSRCLNELPNMNAERANQSNCSSTSNQAEVSIQKAVEAPQCSSTSGNKKLKRPRIVHPNEMAELEVKRAELEASEAIKTAADKIMDAAVMITNCMRELQPKLKSIANRNYREIQMSANAIRQLTSEVAKLGVLLSDPKSYSNVDQPKLLIPKGPFAGEDLALVGGLTPQVIGRNASKKLWTVDELKTHMLSPKVKSKGGEEARTGFRLLEKISLKYRKDKDIRFKMSRSSKSSHSRRTSNSLITMPHKISQTFTGDEIKRLNLRFRKLDKDHSGKLSVRELKSLPGFPKNQLIYRIIDILDQDGDGEIDFHEFIDGLSQFSVKGEKTRKLQFAFQIYDLDGDGYISTKDLFNVLKIMSGENLTMKQLHSVVDKTMYEADTNDDGRISFLEFSQIVESMDEFKKMVVQNV
ncbi:uncharacterized protein LOC142353562 isoform X2 [Convolutriloba macropyga]|uniref:uncharacterized protein LOC142353562 isoform X2 n=1 Tax=Convolutriloba macropyga TaxID=536237 RepID=UPI003F5284B4